MTIRAELFEASCALSRNYGPEATSGSLSDHSYLATRVIAFIVQSGQTHDFEDYQNGHLLSSSDMSQTRHGHDSASVGGPHERRAAEEVSNMGQTQQFFKDLLAATKNAPEIAVAIDAIEYVTVTRQTARLADFLAHISAGAPSYVVAAFDTIEVAKAWIQKNPRPPDHADILIGRDYYTIQYDPERKRRALWRDRAVEWQIVQSRNWKPPVSVASFASEDEARVWMDAQSSPVRRAWVTIGGVIHLAVHYTNIDRKMLFPLAMADDVEIEV